MIQLPEHIHSLLMDRGYLHAGEETWEDLSRRVAKALASAEAEEHRELWEQKFYDLLAHLKFVNSSPTLMNADVNDMGGLSSCFVIDIRDDLKQIHKAMGRCAKIYQYNGGVGFDISPLRPAKAPLGTAHGKAGGPVAFMEEFNLAAEIAVRHNQRKSATKIDMQIWHPDIREFIHCKDDGQSLTNMNISVSISDRFMACVKDDLQWQLVFPDYAACKDIYNAEWNGDLDKWLANGRPIKTYETVRARDLYGELCESAWKRGDPGVSFYDHLNLRNPNKHIGRVAGTNPCFSGEMELLTDNGFQTFASLADTEPSILGANGHLERGRVWCSGQKETIELRFADKSAIICTPDHEFMTVDSNAEKAKDLHGKRLMPNYQVCYVPDPTYVRYGFMQGDGCLSDMNNPAKKGIAVFIGEKDTDILDLFSSLAVYNGGCNYYVSGVREELLALGFDPSILPERVFPTGYDGFTRVQKASFLRGCYSANGSVISKTRLAYKTTSRVFADQLANTLHKDFGIEAYITTNRATPVEFENGTYTCRESYDVSIHNYLGLKRFTAYIGFHQLYKQMKLRDLMVCRSPQVTKITEVGTRPVYDFTEPKTHWGVVEGFLAHNCAEFNSLPYTSCCLGSFNLMAYTRAGQLDIDALKLDIPIAVRMLDNVITLNRYPLKKIRSMTQANRSIGIGVMGLADMLYSQHMPYGCAESCEYVDQLMRVLTNEAEDASACLADERGVYGNWKGSSWDDLGFPIRNSDVTSIAPTGTISTICGVSSSIEPVFGLVYERHTAENRTFYMVNKVFEAELRKRGLYSEELLRRIRDNHGSCVGVDGVPEDMQRVFVTAYDVTPEQHIAMCAAVQDAVSLSVSKTVNLQNAATVEDIEAVYMRAFDHGLLGITVYRDGCRDNQVLTTGAAPNLIPEVFVDDDEADPTRPQWGFKMPAHDDVDGLTRKIQTGCGSVHINAFFDRTTRRMTKVYVGRGGRGGCTALINGMGRIVSNMLRLGDTPEGINEELQDTMPCGSYGFRLGSGKQTSKGFSCASAIGWALLDMQREYVLAHEHDVVCEPIVTVRDFYKDQVQTGATRTCPSCSAKLANDGGCVTCVECGWSKCA